MFLFYLVIVNKMRQVSITVSEYAHSNKQPCGKGDIEFIWQFTALSFQILLNLHWKMWKTVAFVCKLLKSLCKRPWGSSKEILLIYYSSIIFENFDWGREVYHFMDLKKGTTELTQIYCFSFACLRELISGFQLFKLSLQEKQAFKFQPKLQ